MGHLGILGDILPFVICICLFLRKSYELSLVSSTSLHPVYFKTYQTHDLADKLSCLSLSTLKFVVGGSYLSWQNLVAMGVTARLAAFRGNLVFSVHLGNGACGSR